MYPYYNPSEAPHASGFWKFGSLEVWRLGGAPEVEARAVAYGDDVTSRCAAITKDTKNHNGTQRLPEWGVQVRSTKPSTATAGCADWLQIKGVLAHAGLPRGANAPRRTENRACRPEGPNLPRPRRTERAASARQMKRRTEKPNFQASKLPSFQSPLHSRHVCDVPSHDAVGRLGRLGPLGRRLPPLCKMVCLTPRRGAPVSPESPASPDPGRVHLRCTNSPKHGVRSPPCPIGPRAGRAPCAHARPAPCAPSFVSFVISKNTLAVLRAVARRPSLCSSVTLREPLCSSGICGSLPVFSWRRKTPGAMPSGVGLPGVLCKEPYWMEESDYCAGVTAYSAGGVAFTVRCVTSPVWKLASS